MMNHTSVANASDRCEVKNSSVPLVPEILDSLTLILQLEPDLYLELDH